MAQQSHVEKYGITPEFENLIAYLSCCQQRFYGRIGHAIDIDALSQEPARWAMQAAHAIAKDTGVGPDGMLVVLQRLRRWQYEGKVTVEQIADVDTMLGNVEDAVPPSYESVIVELVPIIRRRMEHSAIKAAMDDYAKKGDYDKVIHMITRARSLGEQDTSVGIRLGVDSFSVVESLRSLDRLPLGIPDLDIALGGGLPRGQLGMFIGSAGDGKSMALSHIASFASMNGLHVAYATLELPDALVLARMKAAMTGITIDEVLAGSPLAKERIGSMMLGPTWIKNFTPQITTVDTLQEWVKQCEDAAGRPLDLLVVDYADKLTYPLKGKDQGNTYRVMEMVYESLRVFASERKFWTWTASQSTSRESRNSKSQSKSRLDLEHVADSVGKVRVADLVLTLNVREEGTEMMYYVAKNRTGRSRLSIGPLPTEFACGCVYPMPPVSPSLMAGENLLAEEVSMILKKEPF